jgi:beta-glucosidase
MAQPLRGPSDRLDSLMAAHEDFVNNEFFFHAIRTGEIVAPFRDGQYLPSLKGSCDYWALNCYVRQMIDGRKAFPLAPHYRASAFKPLPIPSHMDEMCPELIIDMLMRAKDKPCMITENGLATDDDRYRVVWIASMLQAVRQSIDLGAEVTGYCYWSLLDNWEWGSYDMPFGLAAVDRDSFERHLRASGAFYGDIARANGFRQADLAKHLNAMPSRKSLP